MISVITPSFNQSDWLRFAVASVADQEGVEHEHIIQDALSIDGTSEWLMKDTRVQAFFEKDAGMYDAINRGLRRARGEICAYLNCDEQYLPGTLAKVAAFFAAHPETEVLFGDFVLANERGEPIAYRRVVRPSLAHLRSAPLNTGSCATFFRRTLLERGFFFDPAWKASGDAVWIESLLRAKVSMQTLPEPLAVFTLTGQNLGQSSLSLREGRRRKQTSAPFFRLRKIAALLTHRLHKLWAGAYRRRHVSLAVYTLDSPNQRQHFGASAVGFTWPSQKVEQNGKI